MPCQPQGERIDRGSQACARILSTAAAAARRLGRCWLAGHDSSHWQWPCNRHSQAHNSTAVWAAREAVLASCEKRV